MKTHTPTLYSYRVWERRKGVTDQRGAAVVL